MPSFVNSLFLFVSVFSFFLIFEHFGATAVWSHRRMKISFWTSAAVTKYDQWSDIKNVGSSR